MTEDDWLLADEIAEEAANSLGVHTNPIFEVKKFSSYEACNCFDAARWDAEQGWWPTEEVIRRGQG